MIHINRLTTNAKYRALFSETIKSTFQEDQHAIYIIQNVKAKNIIIIDNIFEIFFSDNNWIAIYHFVQYSINKNSASN